MSFTLRPYRTVSGLDLEEHREDLESLVEMARMIRPKSDEDYSGQPGYTPFNPNDFFLDRSDRGIIPIFRSEVDRIGTRLSGQIAAALGWDMKLSKEHFRDIGWTLFHTDLRNLLGSGLTVGRWHADRFTKNPRGLWISAPGAAGLKLVGSYAEEGVAYCTQRDDPNLIQAFAEDNNQRQIVVNGNTIVETTEDMVHAREDMSLRKDLDLVQYAMRIHWPG